MEDGHINKCKTCTRKDTRERVEILRKNPEWVEKEKKRNREKYHRLGYKDIHKPSPENKKIAIDLFEGRFVDGLKKSELNKIMPVSS